MLGNGGVVRPKDMVYILGVMEISMRVNGRLV